VKTSNLTEMKNVLGSRAGTMREDDNLIAICEPMVYTMRDPQTSHNPIGLYGLLGERFIFYM
jgi:hypothetical protein